MMNEISNKESLATSRFCFNFTPPTHHLSSLATFPLAAFHTAQVRVLATPAISDPVESKSRSDIYECTLVHIISHEEIYTSAGAWKVSVAISSSVGYANKRTWPSLPPTPSLDPS